jgi:hypothetical protein
MHQFLLSRGYNHGDMVILTDEPHVDPYSPSYPSGQNILRAFSWLASNSDNHSLFLHYSGHGGQVQDQNNGGLDDTICPVDFQENGQIDSNILHQHLVSQLPPSAQLHAVFDCCHSGSAMQLPYVYRTDDEGNVNVVDKYGKPIGLYRHCALY